MCPILMLLSSNQCKTDFCCRNQCFGAKMKIMIHAECSIKIDALTISPIHHFVPIYSQNQIYIVIDFGAKIN